MFNQFGEIKSAKVSITPTHESRGYGFVCFTEPEKA
jgi:RNA recognition motif-containing protein